LDRANGFLCGSAVVTVTPTAPFQLAFGAQPATTVVGARLQPPVTVRVEDAFGNLVTDGGDTLVSVALGNNPSGAALRGTTTVMARGGIATFTDLSVSRPGVGYTLFARASALGAGASQPFDVLPSDVGGLTCFRVTAPTRARAGSAFSFTVTALDAFNRPIP